MRHVHFYTEIYVFENFLNFTVHDTQQIPGKFIILSHCQFVNLPMYTSH
jgi:hypothetical protein